MQQYLKRATKSYGYTGKEPIKRYVSGLSYWVTSKGMKQAGVMCSECVKVTVQLSFGAETLWKLTHGGMNDISPWRQYGLNQMFPYDRTGVWTETKAGMAIHNRAMGYPPQ